MSVVDFNVPGAAVPVDRTFLPAVPQEILDRHGARVLHPASAAAAPGQPVPQPTVYRAATLLIPDEVRRHDDFGRIRTALQAVGLQLAEPTGAAAQVDASTPRSVALPVAEGQPGAVVADAWTALQHLKAVALSDQVPAEQRLNPDLVAKIATEHLYFTSPAWNWTGAPHEGSGLPPGSGDGRREIGRRPVSVVASAPRRDPQERRPVIAVLDTGLGPHPWFGMADRNCEPRPDCGVRLWEELQDEILEAEKVAASTIGTQLLDDWRDTPLPSDALLGAVGSETGHGTFIAGIIRQAEPNADVLAIRVMHSDGVAYESDVLYALRAIVERVRTAQRTGDPRNVVDIVSLSCGYFHQTDHQGESEHPLKTVLEDLSDLGVLVVAAAGNHGTTRRFYPAAFATETRNGRPLVLSVGALNINGSKAMFSNFGDWVQNWATGVGVVSTYPTDIRGPRQPQVVIAAQDRATYDDDDFVLGFAVWDGTSFAAPLAAAKLAGGLLAAGPPLADTSHEAQQQRANNALAEATAASRRARAARIPGTGGGPDGR